MQALIHPPSFRSIGLPHPSTSGTAAMLKRNLDQLIALILLIALSPLLLTVALLIAIDSPGPVLYRQARVGLNGRLFQIWKFRSMRVGADAEQAALAALNEMDGPLFKATNDPRVTRIGRFIRKTSIDELPQLLNVLVGDMSLVGPRPPRPVEMEGFAPWHWAKFAVRPGITGLWQTSGRSKLNSLDAMVKLDLWYINTWSPWLDFRLLFRTIPVVLAGEGAH